MGCIFYECKSISSLPEISKWNTQNVTDMNGMFDECNKKLKIPKKFNKGC
jgi:surface protein